MFNYNEFKNLLKIGQEAEQHAILKINKPVIMRQDESNYKKILYDFQTDDNIKYEVKLDLQSKRTKNVFIEVSNYNNVKSGLSITDADYHIIISDDVFYKISTETLKDLIKNKPMARAKDGTTGRLLKVELLKNNSIII